MWGHFGVEIGAIEKNLHLLQATTLSRVSTGTANELIPDRSISSTPRPPPTILVTTLMDGPDIAHAVYMILMSGTSSKTSLSTSSKAAGPSNRREFKALVLTCPRISQGPDRHSERA